MSIKIPEGLHNKQVEKTHIYLYKRYMLSLAVVLKTTVEHIDKMTDMNILDIASEYKHDKSSKAYKCATQIYNHRLFFKSFSENENCASDSIKACFTVEAIFGGWEGLKKEIIDVALKNHFGSGWIYLYSPKKSDKLDVIVEWFPNSDLPIDAHHFCAVDLWEHSVMDLNEESMINLNDYLNRILKMLNLRLINSRIEQLEINEDN